MPIERQRVNVEAFNPAPVLSYELRTLDFESAMQDVYDFFYDVNDFLISCRLPRLQDTLRKAILSGTVSDMLTASMAKHSRALVQSCYHNGHPDLIVGGLYPENRVKAGEEGVEKTTRKSGGAVDTHGARKQWMAVFVYEIDEKTEPAYERASLRFTEVYVAHVTPDDFPPEPIGEVDGKVDDDLPLLASGPVGLADLGGVGDAPRRLQRRLRSFLSR